MRIAVAGTGPLGMNLLVPLLDSPHEVVAVVQNGRKCRGMRRTLEPALAAIFQSGSNVAGAARNLRIPIVWIDRMSDEELAPLRALAPDLILVGGFAIILKPPLLGLPKIGCVNCHSSLLPKHRGPNPFAAVVLTNDNTSGVTFHVMDEGIDTGSILDQTPFPVLDTDTAFTVYERAAQLTGERVLAVVDAIEARGLNGTPQDEAQATYDPKLRDEDRVIDWTAPAADIFRRIRACCLAPFARTCHRGVPIDIARAQLDTAPVTAAPGTVLAAAPLVTVATGDGAITIRVAYSRGRIPMIWPMPWNRPAIGVRLGMNED
jgi:methionyl-tRNA formyltransferase